MGFETFIVTRNDRELIALETKIEPQTQGFSGLCNTLENIKYSIVFPPEGCGNNLKNYIYNIS